MNPFVVNTKTLSCVACRTAKVKCDKSITPCLRCVRCGFNCTRVARKKRLSKKKLFKEDNDNFGKTFSPCSKTLYDEPKPIDVAAHVLSLSFPKVNHRKTILYIRQLALLALRINDGSFFEKLNRLASKFGIIQKEFLSQQDFLKQQSQKLQIHDHLFNPITDIETLPPELSSMNTEKHPFTAQILFEGQFYFLNNREFRKQFFTTDQFHANNPESHSFLQSFLSLESLQHLILEVDKQILRPGSLFGHVDRVCKCFDDKKQPLLASVQMKGLITVDGAIMWGCSIQPIKESTKPMVNHQKTFFSMNQLGQQELPPQLSNQSGLTPNFICSAFDNNLESTNSFLGQSKDSRQLFNLNYSLNQESDHNRESSSSSIFDSDLSVSSRNVNAEPLLFNSNFDSIEKNNQLDSKILWDSSNLRTLDGYRTPKRFTGIHNTELKTDSSKLFLMEENPITINTSKGTTLYLFPEA